MRGRSSAASHITRGRELLRAGLTREWFRDWFGEEYLSVYPHRNETEARDAVNLYHVFAPPADEGPVLDLACGAGRHLRELLSAGYRGVGLDLSMPLLRRARRGERETRLVRGDMRYLPFENAVFGGLTSFFTSFGYFADPADDRRVLSEMRRVLRTGGSFMLDFLNADRVRRDLVPSDQRVISGSRVIQERTIEGDSVVKSIRIEPLDGSEAQTFSERVRLYEQGDLEELLRRAGLESTQRFGDYAGGVYRMDSPRLILAGHATDHGDVSR